MKINGISSGAVLQRDENNSCLVFLETDTDKELSVSMGSIEKTESNIWKLTEISVGGPYEIEISDESETLKFDDIYVGDVWLLAGQSNMEGAGRMRQKDYEYDKAPNEKVRAFYMDKKWDAAKTILHELWKSPDKVHKEIFKRYRDSIIERGLHITDEPPAQRIRGVGPGLFFAKQMFEMTGIPQGVIATAVGGTSIDVWTPSCEENMLTSALDRLKLCGQNICGIFWWQGEADVECADTYAKRFNNTRESIDKICHKKSIPVVQMQLNKSTVPCFYKTKEFIDAWTKFRVMQLEMSKKYPKLTTVATNDLDLDDCIHICADSQEIAGKRAAKAMLYLLEGKGKPEPEIESITLLRDYCVTDLYGVKIKYKNVCGALHSLGVASGFVFSENEEMPSKANIQHIEVKNNEIVIRTEWKLDEIKNKKLWYGYGMDNYCNITDDEGRAIPSVGPIELVNVGVENYEK